MHSSDAQKLEFDKRLIERNQRKGLADEKVLEKHYKALPDVSDKAVEVETIQEPGLTDEAPSAEA